MNWEKFFANMIWGIGAAITAVLSILILLRVDIVLNPDAMLPTRLWEQATQWLAMGFLPMLIACIGAYEVNEIKSRKHAKRNFFLVFLPGLICFLGFAFWAGVWLTGMLNTAGR